MSIQQYVINVGEDRISSLKQRLSLTDWPDELEEAGWNYGAPLADVKRLANYWQDGFDWRSQEAQLNRLPNFQTRLAIDGFGELDIHFVYKKSDVEHAIPLLFVHGWPGSFLEVSKVLPLLTEADSTQPKFIVVAPSLPNFGFSGRVTKRGFGLAQYAETCHKLMQLLGYREYVTQGGDWGFYITRAMSLLYPESCKATHINMIRAQAPTFSSQPLLAAQHAVTPYSPAEKAGTERTKWFAEEGSGYRLLQATKPQTLAYGLTDSPVALLAWMWEKLHDWTDSYPWTDDEILTWVSIYWFSAAGGPGPSLRIYYEATHPSPLSERVLNYVSRDRTQQWIGGGVQLGVAHFPKELRVLPRTWARTLGNVVFEKEHSSGGHFAAWERPQELVEDLREMYGRRGPRGNLVGRKSGHA